MLSYSAKFASSFYGPFRYVSLLTGTMYFDNTIIAEIESLNIGQLYIHVHAEMLLSLLQHLVTEGATSCLQDQEDWP